MEHRLKTIPEYFDAVIDGRKTFELRKDDRGYSVGDTLVLCEWDGKGYTGREVRCKVGYMLEDYAGLTPGYAVLGIVPSSRSR